MSFLVEASILVSATPEAAFDRLADYPTWKSWMPKSFYPVSELPGPLKLAWRGGNGFLHAWHRFLFEAAGENQTRVRSVETWAGFLSPIVKPLVRKLAEKIGREQLEALQASLSTKH
jgi:hypothetical protein